MALILHALCSISSHSMPVRRTASAPKAAPASPNPARSSATTTDIPIKVKAHSSLIPRHHQIECTGSTLSVYDAPDPLTEKLVTPVYPLPTAITV